MECFDLQPWLRIVQPEGAKVVADGDDKFTMDGVLDCLQFLIDFS